MGTSDLVASRVNSVSNFNEPDSVTTTSGYFVKLQKSSVSKGNTISTVIIKDSLLKSVLWENCDRLYLALVTYNFWAKT